MKKCLGPVISDTSRILILGSLPGDQSLEKQRYYAHPGNQFWPTISAVFKEPIPDDDNEKIRLLHRQCVALWDVLKSADRQGSTDGAIKNAVPNEIAELLACYPSLHTIAFNGVKAEKLYPKHVLGQRQIPIVDEPRLVGLPSTSPTPGRNVETMEEKVAEWRAVLIPG